MCSISLTFGHEKKNTNLEYIHLLKTCKCERLGRTLAFTSIEFFDAKNKQMFARGSHTKYITKALKDVSNLLYVNYFAIPFLLTA